MDNGELKMDNERVVHSYHFPFSIPRRGESEGETGLVAFICGIAFFGPHIVLRKC
jgi:hypothetical protein